MTKETVRANCDNIKTELEKSINILDIEAVMNKLNNLTSLSGLSAEVVAQSKRLILERQKPAVINASKANITAGMQRAYVEGECSEEIMLHSFADRLNSAITHAQDALRTIVSMRKSEMENSI